MQWFQSTPSLPNLNSAPSSSQTGSSWFSAVSNLTSFPFQQEENDSIFPSLSWPQRMLAFAASIAVGGLFMFMSMFALLNPSQFAKFYTLGNVFLVLGILFLVSPSKMLKSMFDQSRMYASLIYIASMCLTLYFAIGLGNWVLSFLSVLIQLGASVWYAGSYIPFAQTLLRSAASTVLPV